MPDKIAEERAASQLGITVDELHTLGRQGAFGGWWQPGMDLSPEVVAAARERLAGPAAPRPPWASGAAAAAKATRPAARPATPPGANRESRPATLPPPVATPPPPPSPLPAVPARPVDERRGGRRGGGGGNVRTGREVEIPARAWVASVQRTAVQWTQLQAAVAQRRRRPGGDSVEQIRAQLVRAGVPADVVDMLQPRP
jgi:hypothetical protein